MCGATVCRRHFYCAAPCASIISGLSFFVRPRYMMPHIPARARMTGLIFLVFALFAGIGPVHAQFFGGRGEKPPAVRAIKEHRVALVIGNARYSGSPLKNPVNDARAMARSLRELGFDVIEKIDAGQKDINRAITQFRQKITSDSVALFYYAGHGMQVRGNNYLIPVDANISTEATIGTEAVNMDTVLQQLNEAGSRVNIVILDACRNNPYERRFRGTSGGLASMDAPKGTLIAYATAPGKVAMDGEGSNGLYTSELLKALRKPGLQVEEVFKQVRIQVTQASGDSQTPWESSSLTGQFYFTTPPALVTPAPAQAVSQQDNGAVELEVWRGAQRLDTEAAYRAYLDQYPQGRFVALAKAATAKLKQGQKPPPTAAAASPEPAARPAAPAKPAVVAKAAPAPSPAPAPERAAEKTPAPEPAPGAAIHRTGRADCPSREREASFFKDEALRMSVGTKLQFSKALLQEKIEVRASGGVVTLTGGVLNEERAEIAGRVAAQVSGVHCVNNLLQVGASAHDPTDIFRGR